MVGAFMRRRRKLGAAAIVPSLLLHFNGTNGSTTFTDSSPNGHTMTANVNAKLTTPAPKFGTACLSLFSTGTTDSVDGPAHASFALGAGDFTIEMFVKNSAAITTNAIIGQNTSSATAQNLQVRVTSGGGSFLNVIFEGTAVITSADLNTSLTDGAWHHLAVCRVGNTVTMYWDGTAVGSTWNATGHSVWDSATGLRIGANSSAANPWKGPIDELRVVKGTAVYTSNFTPPIAEFT